MDRVQLKKLQLALARTAQHNLLVNHGINITGMQAADLAAHLVMSVQLFAKKYSDEKKEKANAL